MMENKILDLGCGDKKLNQKESFPNYSFEGKIVGLDGKKNSGADVICNLEKGKLPFKENFFDIVYTNSTLQYISNTTEIVEEVYRILKKGGKFLIKVPYFSKSNSFTELAVKRRFGWTTFDVFIIPPIKDSYKKRFSYYNPYEKRKDLFNIINKKILLGKFHKKIGVQFLANRFPSIYEKFLCWIFPGKTITYEFEKV